MAHGYPDRPTYSERRGRGRRAKSLDYPELRSLVARILADLFRNNRLQEAFGYDCVDEGQVPGRLGSDPDVYFQSRLGFPVMPPERTVPEMEPDELFDFIEVLHDLVSEGDEDGGRYHDFSNCGWHFRYFSAQPAQQELREVLNPLLRRLETPLELTEEGCIEERAADELRPLLEAEVPDGVPEDDVAARVAGAVQRFRRARGEVEGQKDAVRDLADVLEFLRPQVKAAMLSADEAALFELANRFAIRHHNREQRGDYEKPVWLRWAFYVYLATIHAVVRVTERQSGAA